MIDFRVENRNIYWGDDYGGGGDCFMMRNKDSIIIGAKKTILLVLDISTFPHTINGEVANTYQEFQELFLAAGGVFPPNPSELLLNLTDIYQDGTEWKIRDSANGYDCQVVESACVQGDGVSNYVIDSTPTFSTQRPHLKVEIESLSGEDEWYINRRSVTNNNLIAYQTSSYFGEFYFGCTFSTAGFKLIVSSVSQTIGGKYTVEGWYDGEYINIMVNGVIDRLYIGADTVVNDYPIVFMKAAWDSMFYVKSKLSKMYVGDYDTGEAFYNFNLANTREGYIVDTVSGTWFPVQGDVTNLHTTSNGRPHNALDKTDVYHLIADPTKKLYVPYKEDGTQIALDPAFAALYEFEETSPAGVMYNTESEILFPDGLQNAAELFGNNIFYDGAGNPTPFALKDLTELSWDYEQAKTLFTNISNINENGKLLWYNTPQVGEDFNAIAEAFGAVEYAEKDNTGAYYLVDGEYNILTDYNN